MKVKIITQLLKNYIRKINSNLNYFKFNIIFILFEKDLLADPSSTFYGIVQESKDRSALMKMAANGKTNIVKSNEGNLAEKERKLNEKIIIQSSSF